MAEAAAAFYAVETAVEGAVVGTAVVAQPTVPLYVRFHKIKSPSPSLILKSHTLNIIKGKAYIFGGDTENGITDNSVKTITLPTDLAMTDIDYQTIEAVAAPERPLAPYSDNTSNQEISKGNERLHDAVPTPRAAHSATSIDSNIYIFGGRPTQSSVDKSTPLEEDGIVHAFSTITNKWTSLLPHATKCSSGTPCPRTYASLASTPHPLPKNAQTVTVEDHGTIFLHGGYDAEGQLLRDVWTFDISSKVWSRWPDIPSPGPEDIAGEGSIVCVESRLWRTGDGFGKIVYLEIVRDDANDFSGKLELGVSPKTGDWKLISFGETDPNQDVLPQTEKSESNTGITRSDRLPVPRKGAGFLPITTGAGREYLLYFMGEDGPNSTLADVWTYQLSSDKMSAAILKDKIRATFGKSTGENQWSKCEIIQSTKDDGVLELPRGLSRFASDSWKDFGGAATFIWGGTTGDGKIQNEGWIAIVD